MGFDTKEINLVTKITMIVFINNDNNIPGYSKPFNIYVHTDSLEGSSSPAESSNR